MVKDKWHDYQSFDDFKPQNQLNSTQTRLTKPPVQPPKYWNSSKAVTQEGLDMPELASFNYDDIINFKNPKVDKVLQKYKKLASSKEEVKTEGLDSVQKTVRLSKLDYFFLVMELKDMSLEKMLSSVPKVNLKEQHVVTILYNQLSALNYIHSANIV